MSNPFGNSESLATPHPYPALLPHSIKVYPIVQFANKIGPQSPESWPPKMNRGVMDWRDEVDNAHSARNQIYIHIPFCPFLCHFCPLYKVEDSFERSSDHKEVYVETLIEEINSYGKINRSFQGAFHSIYFGGGTPTELAPSQLKRILRALRNNFNVAPDAEITLEGVARQMLLNDYLEECMEDGFNRISFGIQSFDPNVRKQIGRGDKIEDYFDLIKHARKVNPDLSINVEIMAGLPGQTQGSLAADIDQLVRLNTDSVDILYYVMMPGTKLKNLINKGKRESPYYGNDLLKMRQMVNSVFNKAGYKQITGEVFTKTDRDLFVQTSFFRGTGLNTILAFGPSAFGLINGTVYHNVCDLAEYIKTIKKGLLPINTAETLNLKTAQRRSLLLSILQLEIPGFLVNNRYMKKLIRKWTELGLVESQGDGFQLTPLGSLWYNHMQMDLLSPMDIIRSIRMFGSIGEQIEAISHGNSGNSQDQEMLKLIKNSGNSSFLGLTSYKMILKVLSLPIFDKRAVGFTGPVDE
jgi:oxygen-independent coproporphyrinogen-3 oxidase